jgi:uncharacterized protein YcbX
MKATVSSLYRHPVKGFTPEPLDRVSLTTGACFPCDRLYAVEVGPSGFDEATPAHVSKMKFTVLARMAEVARVRTRFDEASSRLSVTAEGMEDLVADLSAPTGRIALEGWLTRFLGEAATGPLRVLEAPGPHRFMDDPSGHISIVNLASVRDLEARLGVAVDPLRFRANLYVEGWPAWSELDCTGRGLTLGTARAVVVKSIVRCAATHVDPVTGQRDLDLVSALFNHYGHRFCGLYVRVTEDGVIGQGDRLAWTE